MPSWALTLIVVPLIAFGLYRRFKRTFGVQPFTPKRMIARMVLLSIISVLLIRFAQSTTDYLAAAGGGTCGLALALFGLSLTRFENTQAAGKSYTPNRWIGIVVTALFLGRLVVRFATVTLNAPVAAEAARAGSPFAGMQRSPLTLGIFCLMAAYYIFYYGGVLWKGRTLPVTTPAAAPPIEAPRSD